MFLASIFINLRRFYRRFYTAKAKKEEDLRSGLAQSHRGKKEVAINGVTMADIKLGFNCHGKGRVRVVKVRRNADGTQDVIQLSVQLLLEG